jgi:hypothetical protein
MSNENKSENRMWKDAPAALCEFVGVDPARKWAQCEKERDEWAALAGQYKQERDEARDELEILRSNKMSDPLLATTFKHLKAERDEAREALKASAELLCFFFEKAGITRKDLEERLEAAK